MECKIIGTNDTPYKAEEKINELLKKLEKENKIINKIVPTKDYHVIIFFGEKPKGQEMPNMDISKLFGQLLKGAI